MENLDLILGVLTDPDLDDATARQVAYDLLLSLLTEVPENEEEAA